MYNQDNINICIMRLSKELSGNKLCNLDAG